MISQLCYSAWLVIDEQDKHYACYARDACFIINAIKISILESASYTRTSNILVS